jgi:pyruvate dehydrogenase complex dehydrogenase (E1) component
LGIGEENVWLNVWMVHQADRIHLSRDELKVGSHQVSCVSMVTLVTGL